MPTARELLEQADALMRRNRGGAGGIPVLTEHVSAANAAEAEDLSFVLDRSLQDGEPPVLTDVVEEVAVDLVPLPTGKQDDDWLGPDTVDPELHSITGPSPDTVGVVPAVTLRSVAEPHKTQSGERVSVAEPPTPETPEPASTMTSDAAAAETPAASMATSNAAVTETPAAAMATSDAAVTEAPEAEETPQAVDAVGAPAAGPRESVSGASDDERWRSLAEQVSMQVLQRLDLFIDTGLKAQLAAHLQPIVERAGAELVGKINDHVGQLVRSYVAEAIEREIAQWRQDQR
jgi:hypothetical protein